MTTSSKFIDYFSEVTDPRRGEPVYSLESILFISICAVICGADDFVAIAKFGRTKKDWIAKYVDAKADYCLAAKGNQPTLHDGMSDFFLDHLEDDFARVPVRRFETNEKGHGREDFRSYFICPLPENLPDAGRWENLKAIGIAINNSLRNGKMSVEVRYYILSRYVSGRRFAEAVRSHWGIENSLHWQLDVTFSEDQSRIWKGHADTNFSTLRRTALSLLKKEEMLKVGIKNKRLNAGWDDDYLAKVLFGQ